ncbi:uncharacterized protein PHALS_14854 [Plasmopara halstedii]|uniref:RxLR-like protein n=1 Tax=Plasmopara halstedii TaxID=4781 RepID=A0A0P1AYW1_PLAHL|nr:uncharacterized protein PHALS_14854 [Plasmopara halstedii]CEG45985.1 hypothetical protein PHALS_14854 [Plasmopara halstedii]|eukprot:XP_024582354.1 hypothetical protein PHALS_14854 [Plasmopara halstedii]
MIVHCICFIFIGKIVCHWSLTLTYAEDTLPSRHALIKPPQSRLSSDLRVKVSPFPERLSMILGCYFG